MGQQLSKVDRVAPGFQAEAVRMRRDEGKQIREIYAVFVQRFPKAKVGRSSFHRWFAKVSAANGLDEESRLRVRRPDVETAIEKRLGRVVDRLEALIAKFEKLSG